MSRTLSCSKKIFETPPILKYDHSRSSYRISRCGYGNNQYVVFAHANGPSLRRYEVDLSVSGFPVFKSHCTKSNYAPEVKLGCPGRLERIRGQIIVDRANTWPCAIWICPESRRPNNQHACFSSSSFCRKQIGKMLARDEDLGFCALHSENRDAKKNGGDPTSDDSAHWLRTK